jgi:hypothetical protein
MQSFRFARRDSARSLAAQQRFSFGDSPDEFVAPRRYRSGWISDAHLGTRGANAVALLDFLREYDFETLYIVGDLIDTGHQMAAHRRVDRRRDVLVRFDHVLRSALLQLTKDMFGSFPRLGAQPSCLFQARLA